MTMIRPILFAALLATGASDTLAAEAPTKTVPYKVKQGDTLLSLGRRYFNQVSDYRVVRDLNHLPDQDFIPVNMVLTIPVSILRGTPLQAKLVSYRGAVAIGDGGGTPKPGMVLAEGTKLVTGPDAFLTITVADGSTISMPSNSVMRLSHMRRLLLVDAVDQEFMVERGHVQTQVMKQTDPNGGYRMRTPIAVSAVRGTQFRIGYGDGPSLTEVLGGTVAVGQPGATPVPVPMGIGAAVAADGGFATEKLLPAPARAGQGGVLTQPEAAIDLTEIPGAVRYHVQLAHDARFDDVFAEATGTTPHVVFPTIPDGDYYARATAISATNFEGLPSTFQISRNLLAIEAQGGSAGPHQGHFAWTGYGEGRLVYRFQLFAAGAGTVPILDLMPDRNELDIRYLYAPSYRWRVGVSRASDPAHTIWSPLTEIANPPAPGPGY